MIDTHAHLTDRRYSSAGELIVEAKQAGVSNIFCVGYNLASSNASARIASENDGVYFTAGVHPSDCEELDNGVIDALSVLLRHEKCIAAGEIGLDYYYGKDNKQRQQEAFEAQIELAKKANLPFVVHSRDATGDMIKILTAHKSDLQRGFLMHCYSESLESAKIYLDLGGYFAFGGAITFKNAKKEDIIKGIPVDRVMCETDCPYMAPVPLRGTQNVPKNVALVYQKMAGIYGMEHDELRAQVRKNVANFFGLSQLGE